MSDIHKSDHTLSDFSVSHITNIANASISLGGELLNEQRACNQYVFPIHPTKARLEEDKVAYPRLLEISIQTLNDIILSLLKPSSSLFSRH